MHLNPKDVLMAFHGLICWWSFAFPAPGTRSSSSRSHPYASGHMVKNMAGVDGSGINIYIYILYCPWISGMNPVCLLFCLYICGINPMMYSRFRWQVKEAMSNDIKVPSTPLPLQWGGCMTYLGFWTQCWMDFGLYFIWLIQHV